ncbi:MAG: YvcK family protein [Anaerolineae bacterium]|nr:YvcK family protein [Anaerolineae bacterium]
MWLTPGIGVKRWLIVLFFGVTALGLGFGILLLHFFRTYPVPPVESILTLGGAPLWLRAVLAGVVGAALVVLAMYRISRTILSPWDVGRDRLIETLVEQRHLQRGPKIVAIGGGTGLPALLRGLKDFTSNLTAIVTVADDGGSSGRLRRDLGVLPPGDFRNNIAALARNENLMTQLFQYRFGEGGLEGHSFGNLFITALSSVTGSFEQALIESSRVLAIRGQVLPSTLEDVTLMADLRDEPSSQTRRVEGESAIPEIEGAIERVFLEPENAPAYPDAVKAILAADIVVIGPGSLFTSILPNLLVPGIVEAIRRTRALRVYVCNVATQSGETSGFSVIDHVRAIERQVGPGLFDVVLVNDYYPALDADANFAYVQLGMSNGNSGSGARIVSSPLVDQQYPWRHDSRLLAQAVINLVEASEDATT